MLMTDFSSVRFLCARVILLCAFCNKLLGVCGVSYSLRDRSFLCGGVRGLIADMAGFVNMESATWSSSESSQLNGIGDSRVLGDLGDLRSFRGLVLTGDSSDESQNTDGESLQRLRMGLTDSMEASFALESISPSSSSWKLRTVAIPSCPLRSPRVGKSNLPLHRDIVVLTALE